MNNLKTKILSILFILLFFIISFSIYSEADRKPVICKKSQKICIEDLNILGDKVIVNEDPEED